MSTTSLPGQYAVMPCGHDETLFGAQMKRTWVSSIPMSRKIVTTRRNASGYVTGSIPHGTHEPFISAMGAISSDRPSPRPSHVCTLDAHSVITESIDPFATSADEAKISRLATGVASARHTSSRMWSVFSRPSSG